MAILDEITRNHCITLDELLHYQPAAYNFPFTMAQQCDLTSSIGTKSYLQTYGCPSCISVERLVEGWSGFVYCAQLLEEPGRQHSKTDQEDVHPLKLTEPSSIIVKHVEGYAARLPGFKIGQERIVRHLR
jgi:hypothetical protein